MKKKNIRTDLKSLFGRALQKRRSSLGLSSSDISKTMDFSPSYYRAIEAGKFSPGCGNTIKLATVMRWDVVAVSLVLQIIIDVHSAIIAKKTVEEKGEAEKLVMSGWFVMCPELTFLQYDEKSFDLMSGFLLVGFGSANFDRQINLFLKQNPEFLKNLKAFMNTFS